MDELKGITEVKRFTKGEQTKNKILTSAIAVLASNGIKGTTHRAVAQHGNIQLSLTTYYFKDIQELIHQAFHLNSEQTRSNIDETWQNAFTVIESFNKTSLRKVATKIELCEKLTQISVQHLYIQICQQPAALAVEQLLFTEIQITPALRKLAQKHKTTITAPLIRIARYFNKNEPEVYAEIMLIVFTQLKYRFLSVKPEDIDLEQMTKIVKNLVSWVIGVKN